MMYKIINHIAPNYLNDLLPQTAAERNPYPVRDANLYSNFRTRTDLFYNSFYPKTIREWNMLPPEIKAALTESSFKYKLKQTDEFKIIPTPKWFSYMEIEN